MKTILSLIISGALVVSGLGQTRNVLVGTNNSVVQPTNFWSADASNARTGLGLGSAATNPASAFQPSSTTLSNLASSNAVNLTNLRATNLVGLIPTSNIPPTTLTNIGGTLAIASGGTGATNASNARVNLGATTVGNNLFTATNAEAARTAIGTLATNGNAAGLTNLTAANITGTVGLASNVTGTIAISNGGTGATNAGGARTNLGLGPSNNVQFNQVDVGVLLVDGGRIEFNEGAEGPSRTNLGLGATWLTNTNVTNFRTAIGLGETNSVTFDGLYSTGIFEVGSGSNTVNIDPTAGISFGNAVVAAITRINFGLGLPALTNTNNANFLAAFFGANTNPVLYNTNGEVVSPTNFWQVAPIVAQFIETQPTTNSTTNLSGGRLFHVHSLATNIVNVTNTIVLPTNGTAFAGDIALIVHQGPTNTMTRVQQAGSTNNLITMTRFDEAIEFVYYEGSWEFNHLPSYVEPIFFSGTNASANAAASRTNLGLGATNDVEFGSVSTATLKESGNIIIDLANSYLFNTNAGGSAALDWQGTEIVVGLPIFFSDTTNAATTRTNLGLGATNDVTFSNVTASGTLTATSTVTAKTNLVVEGFVDYTAARTNNTPTNTPNFAAHAAWIEVKIGTNSFFLPAYQ